MAQLPCSPKTQPRETSSRLREPVVFTGFSGGGCLVKELVIGSLKYLVAAAGSHVREKSAEGDVHLLNLIVNIRACLLQEGAVAFCRPRSRRRWK